MTPHINARRQLEVREFDVVLCDFHFDGNQTGQELIDDLRRANVLPFSTVFIMVTGEAAYDKVAEAAESALAELGWEPRTRAEALGLTEFAALQRALGLFIKL